MNARCVFFHFCVLSSVRVRVAVPRGPSARHAAHAFCVSSLPRVFWLLYPFIPFSIPISVWVSGFSRVTIHTSQPIGVRRFLFCVSFRASVLSRGDRAVAPRSSLHTSLNLAPGVQCATTERRTQDTAQRRASAIAHESCVMSRMRQIYPTDATPTAHRSTHRSPRAHTRTRGVRQSQCS